MFRILGLKFRIEGTEHLPRTGGVVLVSNHVSYLDFIFSGLGANPAGRLVRFMAKKQVFDNKISGPLMRGMHHIPVDREAVRLRLVEVLGGGQEPLPHQSRRLPQVGAGHRQAAIAAAARDPYAAAVSA